MKVLPICLIALLLGASAHAATSGAVIREEGAIYLEDLLMKPARLATVADAAGTTTYSYDAVGNLAATSYPNGISTTYFYDQLNRLTQLTNTGTGGVVYRTPTRWVLPATARKSSKPGPRLSLPDFAKRLAPKMTDTTGALAAHSRFLGTRRER